MPKLERPCTLLQNLQENFSVLQKVIGISNKFFAIVVSHPTIGKSFIGKTDWQGKAMVAHCESQGSIEQAVVTPTRTKERISF